MIDCPLPAVNVRGNVSGNVLSGVSDPGAFILSLSPTTWYRFNRGITVVGSGVDKWVDQSGNGHDLRQTTDTNRPALNADGSITFDGVDNYLSATYTRPVPATVYLLGTQITWVLSGTIFDGVTGNSMRAYQQGVSPGLRMYAGLAEITGPSTWTLGTKDVVCVVFNGASSSFQIGNGTPSTGNPGSTAGAGLTIASFGGGANYANITAYEVIDFSAAHDAATRARVIAYLKTL